MPVPITVALHCEAALAVTVAGEQRALTEETADAEPEDWPVLPQPRSAQTSIGTAKAAITLCRRWSPGASI